MQKRKQNIALAVSCAVLLVFASVCAYTVSTESSVNSLTVGSIDISLTEDKWQENSVIVPDTALDKNPVVVNKGKNDTYVFAKISVPYVENVNIDYSDNVPDSVDVVGHVQGQKMPKVANKPLPLFKFGVTENNVTAYDVNVTQEQLVHDNWVLVEGYPKKNEKTRKLIYVYVYTEKTGDTVQLKKVPCTGENNKTEPVFDKIKVVNFSDTYGGISGKYSVDADAYGIQTEFLNDLNVANIKEVWESLTSEIDGGDGT